MMDITHTRKKAYSGIMHDLDDDDDDELLCMDAMTLNS